MSDQLAMLRKIAEFPEDDTPRLVYADWLEETGIEANIARAEFIRTEIQLHHLPVDSPERWNLRSTVLSLLLPHAQLWWDELPKISGVTWGWFERGFVEHLIGGWEPFHTHHRLIFESAPIISLNLTNVHDWEISRFLQMPALQQLRRLEFNEPARWGAPGTPLLTDWVIDSLLRCPHLCNIQKLTFRSSSIGMTHEQRRDAKARLQRRFSEVIT